MGIVYRPARLEELPACVDLFMESVTDLHRRHNLPGSPQPVAWRLDAYRHIHATGIFHVAEVDGALAGFACAFVRGRVWFLAGFWVQPAMQNKHLGAGLLRGVMDAGRQAGAETFFVWASIDFPAVAAYMKNGMLPGSPIFSFEGVARLQDAPDGYSLAPAEMALIDRMDEQVLEMPRPQDHALMQRLGWRPRQVMHRGEPAGYFYVREGGVIGPGAWIESQHAQAVMQLGCRQAMAEYGNVALQVTGMNHDALRFALEAGLRLTGHAHLLTTAPFGHLDRYLSSGAQFF